MVTALLTASWKSTALSAGWRRRTGVLRADLLATPFLNYVHPEDVPEMLTLGELLDFVSASTRVRMGYWNQWFEVLLEAERRTHGLARVHVHAEELPKSLWWRPTVGELPPEPTPTLMH